MNVVEINFKFCFVSDGMFPETTLPYVLFAMNTLGKSGRFPSSAWVTRCAQVLGKACLDFSDSLGVRVIPLRKRPDHVDVIGKYDRCMKLEGEFLPNLETGHAKEVHMFVI